MTEQPGRDEATEAAENVAETVESWQTTAEESTVREELDEGLADAGVEVPEDEKDELVEQIKQGEPSPQVDRAEPSDSE